MDADIGTVTSSGEIQDVHPHVPQAHWHHLQPMRGSIREFACDSLALCAACCQSGSATQPAGFKPELYQHRRPEAW